MMLFIAHSDVELFSISAAIASIWPNQVFNAADIVIHSDMFDWQFTIRFVYPTVIGNIVSNSNYFHKHGIGSIHIHELAMNFS